MWLRLTAIVYTPAHAPYGLWDFRQIDLIRTHTKVNHPIGSALTPVPQLFVQAPHFFFVFFPPRFSPPWSSSPTVQVRFVCGTSPSPDVVEKRCGCELSCSAVLSPCSAAALCDRRVYEVAAGRWVREKKDRGRRRTRCVASSLFRVLSFASRASLFPPPPAVSSTLIRLPSSSDWCKRSAVCNAGRAENSRNAQPLDLATVAPARVTLGVSRRTVGGGSVGVFIGLGDVRLGRRKRTADREVGLDYFARSGILEVSFHITLSLTMFGV